MPEASSESVYVLVHGSWHSGESWQRVVPLLEASGHRVFAPTLTGHGDLAALMTREVGLYTHVDDIIRFILVHDLTEVILVGHSYAGAVIVSVANVIPERISHLVYVDAVVPDDGESAVDVMPAVFQPFIDKAAATEINWLMPPPPASPAGLFGITDPADIEWVSGTLTNQAVLSWRQPARLGNVTANAISRTHIHCALHPRADARRTVPPVQPNGTPAQVWDLRSGHDCMIIAPRELTDLLLTVRITSQQLEQSL
jgi:pimeloyl-ACP methyl ester carboxylesterase